MTSLSARASGAGAASGALPALLGPLPAPALDADLPVVLRGVADSGWRPAGLLDLDIAGLVGEVAVAIAGTLVTTRRVIP